ncbi:MAG: TnpV protein [Faecousia sp.]
MKPQLSYMRSGDYWIPNLKLESTEERPLNKYGRMRRTFLRKHNLIQYSILVMQQKLFPHLWEVQEAAERRLEQIMDGLLAQNPGPDKAADQLGWVQHRNCLRAQAEEIIFSELIFA